MTTTLSIQTTVGQLVAERPSRARVFEELKIDYCCGGKLPLAEACQRKGLNAEEVLARLAASDAANGEKLGTDWVRAPLGELVDHIVGTHHAYLREELPRLDRLTDRVAQVHGHEHPEVVKIRNVFLHMRPELENHMMKEEHILFPWVKAMEQGDNVPFLPAASVASPIQCMVAEHDDAGAALEQFRELSGGYNPPDGACNTWRVLYAALEYLEADMHQHVHKENNILFPRALELEQGVKA